MGIRRNILVDGIEVPFKASATVPRLSRIKLGLYIFRDLQSLKSTVDENDSENSGIQLESLELFENIAYIMARHAEPEKVPDNPDDWLEQFNTFSIYEVLPQLMELWGLNTETQITAKKNLIQLTGK